MPAIIAPLTANSAIRTRCAASLLSASGGKLVVSAARAQKASPMPAAMSMTSRLPRRSLTRAQAMLESRLLASVTDMSVPMNASLTASVRLAKTVRNGMQAAATSSATRMTI